MSACAGAIESLGGDEFGLMRAIPRLPSGMAGGHSVTLILAEGVPRPPGDPTHSCVLNEAQEARFRAIGGVRQRISRTFDRMSAIDRKQPSAAQRSAFSHAARVPPPYRPRRQIAVLTWCFRGSLESL